MNGILQYIRLIRESEKLQSNRESKLGFKNIYDPEKYSDIANDTFTDTRMYMLAICRHEKKGSDVDFLIQKIFARNDNMNINILTL